MQGMQVAVVGGGPGGLVAAGHLAKLGARVTVYERRTEAQQRAPVLGWSIGLGEVGMRALDTAGLSTDLGPHARFEAFAAVAPNGRARHQGPASDSSLSSSWLTNRSNLIEHIRGSLVDKYGSLVSIHHGSRVLGGNIRQGQLTIEPSGSTEGNGELKEVSMSYDLIVVADGAASHLRSTLAEQDTSFKYERSLSGTSTLSFVLPFTPLKQIPLLETPGSTPMHIVPSSHSGDVTGSWVMFASPAKPSSPLKLFLVMSGKPGGEVAAGVSALRPWWESPHTADDAQKLLEESFPQVPKEWLRGCAAAVQAAGEGGPGPRSVGFVECNKLGSGRCVLIGDAAHAVSPNIGCGAANAMADAMFLSGCLNTILSRPPPSGNQHRLDGISEEWTKERIKDAHALTSMSRQVAQLTASTSQRSSALWTTLRCLPIALPMALSSASSSPITGVIKSFINPPSMQSKLTNGPERPAVLKAELNASVYRALGLTGATLAVLVAASIKCAALLRHSMMQ